ncbi:carboxylating nicotinate-nucleotide diphosphorylase [Cytobacillus praedii]|uniref:Probable nicotinate-nucleotide pyrophosphorylase [carboxylating] n=1 Tax=Cytobacillus praedii TaxID=1742358 RepID=A0A4V2NU02_9BACI|nr:carboxylating nicotinate-nucleotide diphosphorylase [Cytobacillus praedii]MED3571471.1 carboxylating nicotinate-nucleotide diphosphorylase [Cytobacillus praedii]TCJ02410.1 carboxylating nicotinate-nucleotide diphosphorylase [Cytobacillus praedii]
MNELKLRLQLEQFFLEDIGDCDITSEQIFGKEQKGEIIFLAKANGIFCGEDVIRTGFALLDQEIKTELRVKDGDPVENGQILAAAKGRVAHLLRGERVILNLIQRLSGIATKTREAISVLGSSHTKICDTRKTTPGLRMLEKYAVRCGGGHNHRFGLYDGVMIKDNHISFSGSITEAVKAVQKTIGHMVKIEVEIESEEQLLEAIAVKADVIMFDNRLPGEIKEWISSVPEGIITEASGGITLENIAEYKDTGVDYISLGFLTHSVEALDISVKVVIEDEVLDKF